MGARCRATITSALERYQPDSPAPRLGNRGRGENREQTSNRRDEHATLRVVLYGGIWNNRCAIYAQRTLSFVIALFASLEDPHITRIWCGTGVKKLRPLASSWEDLPAGTFKEQGTGVNTALLVIGR